MFKIAVMGDKNSICGFASLGMHLFPFEADTVTGKPAETLRMLANNDYAVIFITEWLAESIQDEIRKLSDRPLPAIIPIPGLHGNTGLGLANVSRSVIKAVGSDILSD